MKRIVLLFLLIYLAFTSKAQLCTGSLGDPVIHIDFGSGLNPGPPLAAATTNYGYVTNNCPGDGFYTLMNSTSNCFGSTWHTVIEDHTAGDNNGYFMLVNASFQPGDFYISTVTGLCGNTTYEFAAWVMNVLKPTSCSNAGIDPHLTFSIETTTGTTLATNGSANLPEDASPTWKQYGLFFQTPPGITSVVVRITNNAPGGCGNDLALDDITFRPCGPDIGAAVSISGSTSTNACVGDTNPIVLAGNYTSGFNNPAFQWQLSTNGSPFTDIAGATSINYTRLPTGLGQYAYRLTMAESENIGSFSCRVASNIVIIDVNPLPVVELSDLVEGCKGTDLRFSASGASTYQWTGPNGYTSNLAHAVVNNIDFPDEGVYRVLATSDKGCAVADSTYLKVQPVPTINASAANDICEGSSTLLQASGGVRYEWTPAASLSSATIPDPIATPRDTTVYSVKAWNDFGCADSIQLTVNVWKKPVANAGPDKITREGNPVLLGGSVSGTDVSYYWTPSSGLNDADLLQPLASLNDDRTYTLNAVSNKGCGLASDEVFVKVYKRVVIPNAFSPNNDGINDVWQIPALQTYPAPEITVFNRYGQTVYRSKGYNTPWNGSYNGKRLPVGTYYYVVDLKIDREAPLNGWVMILY